MGRLVGEAFTPFVSDQIKQRQITAGSGFNHTHRTTQQLLVQNNQNTWLKLGSSVRIMSKEDMLELGKKTDPKLTIDDFKDRVDGIQRLKDIGITDSSSFLGKGLAMRSVLFNSLSELHPTTPTSISFYNFRAGVNTQQNQIWNSNSAYGLGGNLQGIVPPPGLIDASIESLNRGSIRKAVVNIKAYNLFQFELIELLYIRLGYTMLLEWGNDKFINNKGNLQKMENTLMEDVWFANDNTMNFRGLIQKVNDYQSQYSGNYDGFVGKVSNFSWDFDTDGSYNITLNLISVGDVIESIKVNNPEEIKTEEEITTKLKTYRTKNSTKGDLQEYEEIKDSPIVTNAGTSQLAYSLFLDIVGGSTKSNLKWWGWQYPYLNLYWALKEDKVGSQIATPKEPSKTITKRTADGPVTLPNPEHDVWEKKYGSGAVAITPPITLDEGEGVDVDKYSYFLTFGELLRRVQMEAIPQLSGDYMLTLDRDEKSNIMSVYPNQISLNPKICLVKPSFSEGLSFVSDMNFQQGTTGIKSSYTFIPRMKDWMVTEGGDGLIYGQIMNIYLNYDFVAACLVKTTKKGELFLYKFLQSICDGINESLGGIPNLEPIIQDDLNIVIQDQNKIRGIETSSTFKSSFSDAPSIDLYGYGIINDPPTSNIVRGFGFKTKIDPSLASMISIGATANGTSTKNYEATAFSNWNSGLRDNYQYDFQDPPEPTPETEDLSLYAPLSSDEWEKMQDKFKNSKELETNFGFTRSSYGKPSTYAEVTFKSKRNIEASCPITHDYWNARTWAEYVNICINYKLRARKPKTKNVIQPSYLKYLVQSFGGKLGGQVNYQPYYFKLNDDFIKMGYELFKLYVNAIDNNVFVKTGSPSTKIGFIPVSMDLTLDGISGAKMFQRLNINQEYLPSQYPRALEFIITKINHKISNNDWETNFSTISVPKTKAENLAGFLEVEVNNQVINQAATVIGNNNISNRLKWTISPNTISLINPKTQDLQYYPEKTTKTQIVLHHTAGRSNFKNDLEQTWMPNYSKVCTHYFIERNGTSTYVFDTDYWANHLGKGSTNKENKTTISIELVALGHLTKNSKGEWIATFNKGKSNESTTVIKNEDTAFAYKCTGPGKNDFEKMTAGYKDYLAYQIYTPAQIVSLRKVLTDIKKKHPDIPIKMDADQWKLMFPPSEGANPRFSTPGIYSHNTWRGKDKTDIFPQLDLLRMLQEFN